MSDMKERLRDNFCIVGCECNNASIMEEAADRLEQLEVALRASQVAMESAFADPEELKFSVKAMDRFAECIANNRDILGATQ